MDSITSYFHKTHYPGAGQPAFQSRERRHCSVTPWLESLQGWKPFTQPLLWKTSVRFLIVSGEFNETHRLVLLSWLSLKKNIINLLAGYSWSGISDTFLSCFRLNTGWKNLQNKPFPCLSPAAPERERKLKSYSSLDITSNFKLLLSFCFFKPLDNT